MIVYFFTLIYLLFFSPILCASEEYVLASDDLIEIVVYNESDLTVTTRVAGDGSINYPLLGKVQVEGLTAEATKELITRRLRKDYLVNPQVIVNVKEYSSIYMLGEVIKPGTYKLSSKTTIMQAITAAGGLTELADRSNIVITRKEDDLKHVFHVNLAQDSEEDFNGKDDLELRPKDVVRVNKLANVNILGEVNSPGQFPLKEKLTVIDAITLAGGFTKIASPNRTRVIRTENNIKRVIKVPVDSILKSGDKKRDFYLKPNDVIIVPESFL